MILIRHGQSEFNVIYGATRQDPGIRDPRLTEEGRRQALRAAEALRGERLSRLVASPYTRALETAEIIAGALGLPIEVEPSIGERVAFTCDIGSSARELGARWPLLDFAHLGDPWWPAHEESEAALGARCLAFRARMAALDDWPEVAVVSHWGFIRALTGLPVPNCAVLRIDPTRPEQPPEPLHMPPRA
jgi:glucosyl-3-phosphoglycerate phosphatase